MPRIVLHVALPFATLAEARAHYARVHAQIWGPPAPPKKLWRRPTVVEQKPAVEVVAANAAPVMSEPERIALAAARAAGCVRVTAIVAVVAEVWGVAPGDLITRRRAFDRPRGIAIALACRLRSLSYRQIGERLGGRDHSTICVAAHRYGPLIDEATRHG